MSWTLQSFFTGVAKYELDGLIFSYVYDAVFNL